MLNEEKGNFEMEGNFVTFLHAFSPPPPNISGGLEEGSLCSVLGSGPCCGGGKSRYFFMSVLYCLWSLFHLSQNTSMEEMQKTFLENVVRWTKNTQ